MESFRVWLIGVALVGFLGITGVVGQSQDRIVNDLKEAWEATLDHQSMKITSTQKTVVEVQGGDGKASDKVSQDESTIYLRRKEGSDEQDMYAKVKLSRDKAVDAELVVLDGKKYMYVTEGAGDQGTGQWLGEKRFKKLDLAPLASSLDTRFKLKEVGDHLDNAGVVKGAPSQTVNGRDATCYDITPTKEFTDTFEAEVLEATYTLCVNDRDLLVRVSSKIVEAHALERDELSLKGDPTGLNVEQDSEMEFSDFDVEVEFPAELLNKVAENGGTSVNGGDRINVKAVGQENSAYTSFNSFPIICLGMVLAALLL